MFVCPPKGVNTLIKIYFSKALTRCQYSFSNRLVKETQTLRQLMNQCPQLAKLAKLNPLQAKWPMKPALNSVFWSVKWMRVFDSPLDRTLIYSRLAPSRHWNSFTYPKRMENWVSLGGKESRTIEFKSWQSRGSNWGPCGQEAEILATAPTMPAQCPQLIRQTAKYRDY